MTTDRPYRAALSVDDAATELRANAGTQFDPAVVDALMQALSEPSPAAA
jgi:HD-GYP domain-containing protein (c-di-GMP phosphodiesterase class II)